MSAAPLRWESRREQATYERARSALRRELRDLRERLDLAETHVTAGPKS